MGKVFLSKSGGGGGGGSAQTYLLAFDDGTEIPAVKTGSEAVFTATANDIRQGTVAATNEGITEGTKVIPAYHTRSGYKLIPAGKEMKIANIDACEYTELQCLICPFNTSVANSVATEKVVIADNVYAVQSTESLAVVTVDAENNTINLGISNEGSAPCLIRYFTFKEEI